MKRLIINPVTILAVLLIGSLAINAYQSVPVRRLRAAAEIKLGINTALVTTAIFFLLRSLPITAPHTGST